MRAAGWTWCLLLSTACGGGGLIPDAGDGPSPIQDDAAVPDAEPGCDAPAGPTMHTSGGVQADETWTAAGRPHIVRGDLTVYATLTLEPCAEVLLAGASTVTVRGALVAEGTAARPIRIAAADPEAPFSQIRTVLGTIRLAHTSVEDGGAPLNTLPELTGTFDLQGADQTAPTQGTLFVDHVAVRRSRSNGIVLRDGAGFADGSTDLTITEAAEFPISLWARAVGTVPSGSYTGNAIDEIAIPGGGGAQAISESTTMHARGVPYRIGIASTFGDVRVERQPGVSGVSTLTIEPGTTLRFKRGGRLMIQTFVGDSPATGALVAVGTAEAPIVFTSAEETPAPGDWLGIWFGLVPDPGNRIQHARIEYAGALSGSGSGACSLPDGGILSAAIRIFGLPASVFITDTEIVSSGRHGIDRGWRAAADPAAYDFLPTNTFRDVGAGGCQQTYPGVTAMRCPMPVPCP